MQMLAMRHLCMLHALHVAAVAGPLDSALPCQVSPCQALAARFSGHQALTFAPSYHSSKTMHAAIQDPAPSAAARLPNS